MEIKNLFCDSRVIEKALDRVVEKEQFSRQIFHGNGWRNRLDLGYIKPRTPERRAALLERACQLSSIVEQNRQVTDATVMSSRQPELARKRDEAILTALRAPCESRGNSALSLNGRTYALVKMDGYSYRYIDVTDKEKYEVIRACNEGGSYIPHLFLKEGDEKQNLGQVVRNHTDLTEWIARAPDGSSADRDLAVKIKKQPEWHGNLNDESARCELKRKSPGAFLFYPSEREGFYKVAYKDLHYLTYAKEFNSSTGQFLAEEKNVLSFTHKLACDVAKSKEKPLADSSFLVNIKKLREWKGNHTDETAHADLSSKWPGSFQLYWDDSEGKHKIAYKGSDRRVHIDEFDGALGKIINGDNDCSEVDVSLVIKQLESLKNSTAQPSVEQLREELSAEKERLNAQRIPTSGINRFSPEQIETYIYWKGQLGAALIVSRKNGNQKDFYAVQSMLQAVDCTHPSDIYAVLRRAARDAPADSRFVSQLRARAAAMAAKDPANAARATSHAVAQGGSDGPVIRWDKALSERHGRASAGGREARQERYARIALQEQQQKL